MTDGNSSLRSNSDSEEVLVEEHEEVENPAETVYNNIRDMSRREYLALAGIGLAGVAGWATDVDGDGVLNGEEVVRGRNPIVAGGSGSGGPAPGDNVTETPGSDRATDTPTGEGGVAIVGYLEGDATREDLTGHLNTVVWYDWMEGNKPTQETKEYMRAAFERAPVTNPDGTTGIALHFIEGEKLQYKRKMEPEQANIAYKNHVPSELRNTVWYLAFVQDIVGGYAGLARGGIDGALVSNHHDVDSIYNDVGKNTAETALEELGHVMGSLEHKMEEPGIQDGPYTVMGDMRADTPLRYRESEWEKILEDAQIVDREDYRLLVPG